MKKFLVIAFAALLAASVTACSNTPNSSSASTEGTSSSVEASSDASDTESSVSEVKKIKTSDGRELTPEEYSEYLMEKGKSALSSTEPEA